MLIGNLGRDPEVKTMQNGGKIVNLSLATTESWRDKATGEKRDKTEWHRVVIFNEALAKICEQYLKKGSKIFIEGQIETRKWQDQSGQDKYSTEVVLRPYTGNLTMLDGRSGDSMGGSQFNDQSQGFNSFSGGGSEAPAAAPQFAPAGGGGAQSAPALADELDDEVPF